MEDSKKKPKMTINLRGSSRLQSSESSKANVPEEKKPQLSTEEPTFWTKCYPCNLRYRYYINVKGQTIRCQRCQEKFVANEVSPGSSVTSSTNPNQPCSTPAVSLNAIEASSISPTPSSMINSNSNRNPPSEMEKNMRDKEAGSESRQRSTAEVTESFDLNFSASCLERPSGVDHFKKGLQAMIDGLLQILQNANIDQLGTLLHYGKIVLRTAADLEINDPGLSALLDHLNEQAAVVASCKSSVSSAKATEESLDDLRKVADEECSKASAILTNIEEKIIDHTARVQEAESYLKQTTEREEMANEALIETEKKIAEAEEELHGKKEKLTIAEESRKKAQDDLHAKDDKCTELQKKLVEKQQELSRLMEELSISKTKWQNLCEQVPRAKDWPM